MLPAPKKGKTAAKQSATTSRASSAEPKTRSARGKGKAKANPLFLDSDEDGDDASMAQSMSAINEDDESAMNEDDDTVTLATAATRPTQRRPGTQAKTRKRVAIMDDDSDNGFGEFGGRRKTRR